MKNKDVIAILSLFSIVLLSACGDSLPEAEQELPPVIPSIPTDTVQVINEFEGFTLTLNTQFTGSQVQWQQISGETISIVHSSSDSASVVLPWIVASSPLQIEASATINSTVVTKRFDINILDRRYLLLNARNEQTESSDLFLNYVSANDSASVPTADTIQLTSVAEGHQVCTPTISPNGRYIAYSINEDPSSFRPTCHGIYVLDIESQVIRRVNKLTRNNQQVTIGILRWSPDGGKIAYRGDHGEGHDQFYVIDIENTTTSYINYLTGSATFTMWPSEDVFPVEDGGNPYSFDTIFGTTNFDLLWLKNSESIYFTVTDDESNDRFLYQGSVHGNARKLERGTTIGESLSILDTEANDEYRERLLDCPSGSTCTIVSVPPVFIELNDRNIINPLKTASSIDGHLMTHATINKNNAGTEKILAVRKPVNDDLAAGTITNIEANDVFDAAWSPTSNDLAFTSGFDVRHKHTDEDVPLNVLTGAEIPGQLYLYQNYQSLHTEAQERLANPQPDIDENFVRLLKWSRDGQYIAYARGEENIEGRFYTSIWVTFVDRIRNETNATIEANTTLMSNLQIDDNYATDFMFAPNGQNVVILLKTNEGTRLRLVNRASQQSFDSDLLNGFVGDDLSSLEAAYSADGNYFAYLDEEFVGTTKVGAVFIIDLSTGEQKRINADLQSQQRIRQQVIQWSPHDDAVIYSVSTIGSSPDYILAKVNGETQNLIEFLQGSYSIRNVIVK